MPLLWRSSRESRSERCKRAFLLAPICKVLLALSLVRASSMLASIPLVEGRHALRGGKPNRSTLKQGCGGCRDRSEFKNRTEQTDVESRTAYFNLYALYDVLRV